MQSASSSNIDEGQECVIPIKERVLEEAHGCVNQCFFLLFNHHIYFPTQPVRGFTITDLLGKP